MKLYKRKNTVLDAESKFAPGQGAGHDPAAAGRLPKDLDRLGELAIELLNDRNLEVSKVRPFFWSLVEAYVDRFQRYPFDVSKMLLSELELNDYPEQHIEKLVQQLEAHFEKAHGRPLRRPARQVAHKDVLGDDMKHLRDSLKYAAMVDEIE